MRLVGVVIRYVLLAILLGVDVDGLVVRVNIDGVPQ